MQKVRLEGIVDSFQNNDEEYRKIRNTVEQKIHSVLSDRRMLLSWPFCLDGYIAREDDSMDWLFTDGDYGFSEFYESTDIIISVEKRMNKS
jgi:hypothetical protein